MMCEQELKGGDIDGNIHSRNGSGRHRQVEFE
jgi:hypothetical protein